MQQQAEQDSCLAIVQGKIVKIFSFQIMIDKIVSFFRPSDAVRAEILRVHEDLENTPNMF
jgi:hypothetical protein